MITLFAGIVTMFILGLQNSAGHFKAGSRISFSLFCGAIGILPGGFFACYLSLFMPMHTVTYERGELASMRSSQGIEGVFVWGIGEVGQPESYNFYQHNSDGSFTPGQVPADKLVHITEDPSLKDKGYWTEVRSEPDHSSIMAWFAFTDLVDTKITRENFRVPVGTVVQNFSVK